MATSTSTQAKQPVATDSQLKSFQEQYKFTSKKRPASSSIVQAAPTSFHIFVRAGLPLLIFAVGGSYVLKSAVEGKNTERDKSRGLISKSERQARLDAERDDMVEKLNKKTLFDAKPKEGIHKLSPLSQTSPILRSNQY